MAIISVKSLLEAGVHFGHRASRWNPKMAPYIYGKRNLIHIINLRETVKGLLKAYHFLSKVTTDGHEILFVGTKRQAQSVVKQEAARCKMHYVSQRWLGGTLTNFETIRRRLARLEELERMEEDGTMEKLSKKLASSLRRERKKIHRNLEGIRNMTSLPSALIIVDPLKEKNAVLEAGKLGIPIIALMDTDSNPDLIDIPIPCNDDAMRSIEVICSKLTDAICKGAAVWQEKKRLEDKRKQEEAAARGGSEDGKRSDRGRRGGNSGGGGGGNKDQKRRHRRRRKTDGRPTGEVKPNAEENAQSPVEAQNQKPAETKDTATAQVEKKTDAANNETKKEES